MAHLKTPSEIEIMVQGGKILAQILQKLKEGVRPNEKTKNLDRLAEQLILERKCRPSFKGYVPGGTVRPYPYTLCISVNDGVVHGLPSDYRIKEGDLIKLDLGLIHKGLHVDAAVTVPVGKVSTQARELIEVTRQALGRGIEAARAGNTLGDIGWTVQSHVETHGFSVVRLLSGHGIGRNLHEDPAVFNFGQRGEGEKIQEGMVLAIEPMVNSGTYKVKQLEDDSFVTADGSLSAHFENTVAITRDGPKVLTVI